MSETKWTKGPWRIGPINYADIYGADGQLAALVPKGYPETGANARLIAAAPELYADACAIQRGFTPDPGTSDLDDEQPTWVRMSLGEYRAACRHIAKARGEA